MRTFLERRTSLVVVLGGLRGGETGLRALGAYTKLDVTLEVASPRGFGAVYESVRLVAVLAEGFGGVGASGFGCEVIPHH